jgi:shikimate dehydrogenase
MTTIDARTKVCAVIGHPISHSLSPALHNAAFAALDLPYVYVAHDVQPGQVGRVLAGMRAMGYRGLSVTIPHKVEAMLAVDAVDEIAKGIGCINTVVNEDGRLLGYNSDGLGALNALRDSEADPAGKNVVILGSGGAARALAITIAREAPPGALSLLGVVAEELEQLVADVRARGRCPAAGHELTEETLRRELESADILLQCTPIGMHPQEDRSLVPAEMLREGMVVFDAVYNPRRTRLLTEAEAAGCRTVEGLEMFLGQARVQFELWTGCSAPQQVMREVVEARL